MVWRVVEHVAVFVSYTEVSTRWMNARGRSEPGYGRKGHPWSKTTTVENAPFCEPLVGPQGLNQSLRVEGAGVGNDGAGGEGDLVVVVPGGDSAVSLAGTARRVVIGVITTALAIPVVGVAI